MTLKNELLQAAKMTVCFAAGASAVRHQWWAMSIFLAMWFVMRNDGGTT